MVCSPQLCARIVKLIKDHERKKSREILPSLGFYSLSNDEKAENGITYNTLSEILAKQDGVMKSRGNSAILSPIKVLSRKEITIINGQIITL